MELSKHSAERIVREINEVLPQKINLMNKKGIIIASTDAARIGEFHGAAYKIIRDGIDEIRIYHDNEYPGTRPGTNFLLRACGEPIGVLGITGSYDTILPIAKVIRKMTELIVTDHELVRMESRREAMRVRFLTDFLLRSGSVVTGDFYQQGLEMGIDIRKKWRVMAVMVHAPEASESTRAEAAQTAQQLLQRAYPSFIVCSMAPYFIAVLTEARDDDWMHSMAMDIRRLIASDMSADSTIGIDMPAEDPVHMQEAWNCARKALESALRRTNTPVKFYSEINMEIFADEVPDASKLKYIQRIFSGYTLQELHDVLSMLELFYENNGSVTKTAAKLYIHKNTLQQHLKKIAARTGYDPRSLSGSAIFYIVIYFYHDLIDAGYEQ